MEHFSDYTEDPRHVLQAGCDDNVWRSFHKGMEEKLWRVDALLLASAIMVGVIVGIDAYSQRYRHHPSTRFIYLGATTLCNPDNHSVLVVTWALLVQNVLINTSIVVAVDKREGRSTGPPITTGNSHSSVRAKTHRKMRIPSEKYFSDGERLEKYTQKYDVRKIDIFYVFTVRKIFFCA